MTRRSAGKCTCRWLLLLAAWGVITAPAEGQTPPPASTPGGGQDAAALAKQLSNPVSALVSVPFQFNWAQSVGPEEATRFILNVQPVMPFTVNEDWNMIARVIVPFVGQPPLVPGGAAATGLGDVLASFFFSPTSVEPFTWGVGPVFSMPSTSEPTLGTGKWSAGPTVVILKQSGPWTYGFLTNQVWSFGGTSSRADVSQLFLQPFLAYTTPAAVTISVNSESIANWKADSGEKWTVPINFAVSKVATFGPLPASYQFGAGVYVEKPTGGPDWQLRSTITLLLPRRK